MPNAPSAHDTKRIRPLFCYSILKSTFYNLVNILDIYRFLIVISSIVITWASSKKLNAILLLSSSFIALIAIVSYILFFVKKSFRLCIHKFYSVTRMFYTLPDTVLTFYIYFEAIQSGFDVNPKHGPAYACAFLTFFLLLSAFNFYWNVLFIRMTFEKIDKPAVEKPLEGDTPKLDIKGEHKENSKSINTGNVVKM